MNDFVTTATIERFIADNPTRDGGSWVGWAGSLAHRVLRHLGVTSKPYAVVNDARFATDILSTKPSQAPVGAIHWFAHSEHGTLAVDVDGGGRRVLTVPDGGKGELVGEGLLTTSVADMAQWPRSTYLGWSLRYGGATNPMVERLARLDDERRVVEEYQEHLERLGIVLARAGTGTPGLPDWNENSTWRKGNPNVLYPIAESVDDLVYGYLDIDCDRLDRERLFLLHEQRIINALAEAS